MVAGCREPEADSLAPSAIAIGSSASNKILRAAGRLQVELAFTGEEALPPGIALTGPDPVVTVEAAGEEAQLLLGDLITVQTPWLLVGVNMPSRTAAPARREVSGFTAAHR
jgi:hypothetical protein